MESSELMLSGSKKYTEVLASADAEPISTCPSTMHVSSPENADTDSSSLASDTKTSSPQKWYIFRYGRLSQRLKEIFKRNHPGLELYVPLYTAKVKSSNGITKYIEKPKIPLYGFIKADKKERVRQFSYENEVSILRTIEDPYQYATIPVDQMLLFRKAVESYNKELEFMDATGINLEKDDKVRITEGEFKGMEGYLKSRRSGKEVCIIIPLVPVPVATSVNAATSNTATATKNSTSNTPTSTKTVTASSNSSINKSASKAKAGSKSRGASITNKAVIQTNTTQTQALHPDLPAYTVRVKPEYVTVVEFSKKGYHFYQNINSYDAHFSRALTSHKEGEPYSELDQKKAMEFVKRFEGTKLDTILQDAKLQALLLCAHTILHQPLHCSSIREHLINDIIPELKSKAETVEANTQAEGQTKKSQHSIPGSSYSITINGPGSSKQKINKPVIGQTLSFVEDKIRLAVTT